MFPMTPFTEELDRIISNLEHGLPEQGSPAAQGGFGAETPEVGESERDLLLEGVLDETIAQHFSPEADAHTDNSGS